MVVISSQGNQEKDNPDKKIVCPNEIKITSQCLAEDLIITHRLFFLSITQNCKPPFIIYHACNNFALYIYQNSLKPFRILHQNTEILHRVGC